MDRIPGTLTSLSKKPHIGLKMRSPKYQVCDAQELPNIPEYEEENNDKYFVVLYRTNGGYLKLSKAVYGYTEGIKQREAIARLGLASALFSLESLAKCVYTLELAKEPINLY